ncbi:Mannose-6-phosphate isomerase, class I [Seinonella peptonophila]|uniref:Mannose-6-phosphate isomerase, class I n=1 Tax=Seinonella peptonophila TaxID=112248 RepID=A0A1M4ZSM9_9BACL|nr:class I mannose-6-phosphate isomerase [Seinonella peptonophila]SHF21021.1 Mannose-6-phosphate isomerase, class I [Seinonella peptonophila]
MAYDLYPEIYIKGETKAYVGYDEIANKIQSDIDKNAARVITIECYPGTDENALRSNLVDKLNPDIVIHSNEIFFSSSEITDMIHHNLTDDRVFGIMSHHHFTDFIDRNRLEQIKKYLADHEGKQIVIYGVGASFISKADVLIYVSLSRSGILSRLEQKNVSNWKADNAEEDTLRKVKRAYFFEWQVADRLKKSLFDQIDYLLDGNQINNPKMVSGQNYQKALSQIVQAPFRLVPFFVPGVWGGNWMQNRFHVGKDKINLAWCFDGVPEENSLYLVFDGTRLEVPAMDVVYQQPSALLGERVYGRFGTDFPIRFDYLDTMNGENLSLQVHPQVEYAQQKFGLHYTQDESYYIMEAADDAVVYLGVKNGVSKEELIHELKQSQEEGTMFPDEKYIYRRNAKKHDHFSIPAGTIHCSGKNSVVLEISSTPNRFTFKLWDWGRVDLDGLPRPIHLDHGANNIRMDRDETWVEREICNPIELVNEEDGLREERTGLHLTEPIETRRHWFSKEVIHETNGSVNVLNLVEGEEIIVKSIDESFDPFIVHYGETFIVPELVKKYIIAPHGPSEGKTVATIKAFIR